MSSQPDLLFVLHDLARQLRTNADRRAAAHGMTRAQWILMFWLERQPGLSQKALAEILEVEPITVARMIDRMEARSLVERRPDPADRRIWRLHLCPAAQPILDGLHGERQSMNSNATEGLDPETIALVTAALCRMKSNVAVLNGTAAHKEPAVKVLEGAAA